MYQCVRTTQTEIEIQPYGSHNYQATHTSVGRKLQKKKLLREFQATTTNSTAVYYSYLYSFLACNQVNPQLADLGYQLSALRSWLPAPSFQLSALNSQLATFNSQFSVLNSQLSTFGFQLSDLSETCLRCVSPSVLQCNRWYRRDTSEKTGAWTRSRPSCKGRNP